MRKLLLTLLLAALPLAASAQKDLKERLARIDTMEFSDEFLDTVQIKKSSKINDYFLIGVNYGVSFSQMDFNPSKHNRSWVFNPNTFSVMITHHEKMFGYIQNFAIMTGFQYSHEGNSFKINEETGNYYGNVDGATDISMEVVEVPFLLQLHADIYPVKAMANLGVYGGYRKSIERSGPYMNTDYEHAFRDYEYRWDYGMQGGAGVALLFDPIEIHFNATLRWAWQSLYEPDYNSKYYYRYAYPISLMVTAGVHFQLTKRSGKTKPQLRREAHDTVYGTTEDNTGQDR